MTDSQNSAKDELFYIAPTEPPVSRKPPAMSVGVVGWMRKNLFSSPANTLLTVITGLFLFWLITLTISWSVQYANWQVVTNNMRLLMVGQYTPDQLGRVFIVAIALTVLSGFSLGFWSQVTRPIFVTIILVVAVMFFIPAISSQFSVPPIRLIVSPDIPPSPLRFVANEGETVSVQIERIDAERALARNGYVGYIEANPATSNSRTIWNELQGNLRAGNIDISEYDLAFRVALLDAQGNELAALTSDAENVENTFSFSVPADGWYGIVTRPLEEAAAIGSTGYAWVRLEGARALTTRSADTRQRIDRYGEPPTFGCGVGTSDCTVESSQRGLRFEGAATFSNYLTEQISPFFRDIVMPVVIALAIAFVSGFVGYTLRNLRDKKLVKNLSLALVILWLLYLPLSFTLLRGFTGNPSLPYVSTSLWGGLLLTMLLTGVAIVASFPIGILLALGRANTRLGVVSTASTVFIEVVRGVPLITILFFAKLILPFFISASSDIEQAIRMMVGLTLFTAAYLAEIVRGGLQIIPKGQTEAAQALGLAPTNITWLIVMPQALRAVIPAIMSQFVSLFKDTTLVSIVGLYELLGIIDFIVNGQQQYRIYQREAYIFVGILYFVISYVMSSISRRIENTGVGSARR